MKTIARQNAPPVMRDSQADGSEAAGLTMERHWVQYGEHRIAFSVVRRERKTLEIGVKPDASVVVVVPRDASIETISAKVRKRAAWIRRQQRYFSQFLPRTPERLFISGETHLYLGRQYRLKVIEGEKPSVKMIRGFIVVRSREPDRSELTRGLVEKWYRDRARIKFTERLEMNLLRFPDTESHRPRALIIRAMRRRWGSLSASSRLVLNRRLIEAPVDGIDYVVTHELCHIAEPHHGSRFYALLDSVMPDWLRRKERLERSVGGGM